MAQNIAAGQINALLSRLTDVTIHIDALNSKRTRMIKDVEDEFAQPLNVATAEHQALVNKIAEIFEESRDELVEHGSKTATLRSGTLQAKLAPASIDITDESAAMAFTRRMGKLKVFTKVGKRTFVKANLQKDPDFVAACPGMEMQQPENLLITLTRTPNQTEVKRELHPLRRKLH